VFELGAGGLGASLVSRVTSGSGVWYLTNAPFIFGRPLAFRLPANPQNDAYQFVPWENQGPGNFPWLVEVEPDVRL
jgi:hypothetical protein